MDNESAIRYSGVNHMAFATGDMGLTIRFWRDLLGMRLLLAYGGNGYKHYFFEISEGSFIAFFEWSRVEPVPEKEHGKAVSGPFAFDHVAVGVADADSLYALKDRLNAADIWVSEVTDHGFIHSIYSFDPNGIPIEFSMFVPEVDLSLNPRMVDSDPSHEARQGAGADEFRCSGYRFGVLRN